MGQMVLCLLLKPGTLAAIAPSWGHCAPVSLLPLHVLLLILPTPRSCDDKKGKGDKGHLWFAFTSFRSLLRTTSLSFMARVMNLV